MTKADDMRALTREAKAERVERAKEAARARSQRHKDAQEVAAARAKAAVPDLLDEIQREAMKGREVYTYTVYTNDRSHRTDGEPVELNLYAHALEREFTLLGFRARAMFDDGQTSSDEGWYGRNAYVEVSWLEPSSKTLR